MGHRGAGQCLANPLTALLSHLVPGLSGLQVVTELVLAVAGGLR